MEARPAAEEGNPTGGCAGTSNCENGGGPVPAAVVGGRPRGVCPVGGRSKGGGTVVETPYGTVEGGSPGSALGAGGGGKPHWVVPDIMAGSVGYTPDVLAGGGCPGIAVCACICA